MEMTLEQHEVSRTNLLTQLAALQRLYLVMEVERDELLKKVEELTVENYYISHDAISAMSQLRATVTVLETALHERRRVRHDQH